MEYRVTEDSDYFERRAETELALAQAADHPNAVRAHYVMAGRYLDRLYAQDNDRAAPADRHVPPSEAGRSKTRLDGDPDRVG